MIENLRAADTGFFGNVVVSCYCQIWFINPYFSFFFSKNPCLSCDQVDAVTVSELNR
jgi:hypothetical protein